MKIKSTDPVKPAVVAALKKEAERRFDRTASRVTMVTRAGGEYRGRVLSSKGVGRHGYDVLGTVAVPADSICGDGLVGGKVPCPLDTNGDGDCQLCASSKGGRPLSYGEETRQVGLKLPASLIDALDAEVARRNEGLDATAEDFAKQLTSRTSLIVELVGERLGDLLARCDGCGRLSKDCGKLTRSGFADATRVSGGFCDGCISEGRAAR